MNQKTFPARDHLLAVSGRLIDETTTTRERTGNPTKQGGSALNKNGNDDANRNAKGPHAAVVAHEAIQKQRQPPPLEEATPQDLQCLIQSQSLTNVTSSSSPSDARVVFATDEWFATADNLLSDSPPTFVPDLYCSQGKVMDGWETRRKRVAGHDWAVVRLGRTVREVWAVELDTAHFTGNHAPRVSVEVANVVANGNDKEEGWMPGAARRLSAGGGVQGTGRSPGEVDEAEAACRGSADWTTVLPVTPLRPGYEGTSVHRFVVPDGVRRRASAATHVRINYYPDGGVARMRVWGKTTTSEEEQGKVDSGVGSTILPRPVSATSVINDLVSLSEGEREGARVSSDDDKVATVASSTSTWVPHSAEPYPHPELSSSTAGGVGLACSNKHYGVPANLIRPTYGRDMGDGWETARHPDRPAIWTKDPATGLLLSPLRDWAVLKLGVPAARGVSRIVLDTRHFKGNFPESVRVEGCYHRAPREDDDAVCEASSGAAGGVEWFVLLPRTKMGPDAEHVFDRSEGHIRNGGRAVSHVRVTIYPDGGLSRVRIYGEKDGYGQRRSSPPIVHRSHL